MTRHEAREQAFFLLFALSFAREQSLEELAAAAAEGRDGELDDYARAVTERAEANLPAIDAKIQRYSTTWKPSRLPRVTLTLLRLALCELDYFPEIPVGASINEAVELAKAYASEEDAAYINGLLGNYVRSEPPHKEPAAPLLDSPQ